ncbi:Ppx/GppA family phosphatase [Aliifodinibius sp. S!AR15-10]|uniref:Ppx/GppA phosphatase family protein n=1 Tax=Aliifodinibius sp. S!AR15-10 TaxID=2950437 RepID=UPI00285D6DCF|nr:Ppx/GppA phosphatase family protein [Aliifodinibius sp. S!AR15-10]MDR8390652.1 Ppx/GppA family phosphatase [Aliifodinibius sp. S!AR15-10]
MTEHSSNGTPTKRIAAIDLGTNSFHAVIVDIYPDGSFRTVDKLKEMVILAEKGLGDILSEDAMDRGLAALKKIKILCDNQGVEEILAYATSAIREARNGGEFIQRMIDEVQVKALAISGKIEAELIGHAVQHGISLDEKPVLMVDIGGGSVEFIIANNKEFFYSTSKKVGVARMAAQFVSTDPISKKEKKKLRNHFKQELSELFEAAEKHGIDTIIGSSGTMENIGQMIANRNSISTKMTLNELQFSSKSYKKFYKDFINRDHDDRLGEKGLDDKRVDIIAPGLVLLRLLTKKLNIQDIKISESALREGMILQYIKKEKESLNLDLLAAKTVGRNPRRRSIFELVRKYRWHEDHSTHVTNMALQLFDELQEQLKLPDGDRELLEYAGYVHDIGYFISRRKHHKHTLYLIRHSDLRGFNNEEINIIANVARYHRRSTPASRHKYYDRQSSGVKERIRKLSGILRVADGLDRSHYQNVQKLEMEVKDGKTHFYITTESDPELEIWGAMRKRQLFEEITGRPLEIYPKEQGEVVDIEQPDPFPEYKS